MKIEFFAPGEPKPQGSKDQFGRESCKLLPAWRSLVSVVASEAMQGRAVSESHTGVKITFMFPRPKSHYGTGNNAAKLKHSAPFQKTSKPDIDKLLRAVLDACTGIVWKDDSQVCAVECGKYYGDRPGAAVTIHLSETENMP